MHINKKMTLLSAVTVVSIGLVAGFTGRTLSKLQDEFVHYQSEVAIARDLIEIKATALSVAKGDPILPDTGDALQQADKRIQTLQKEIGSLAQSEETSKAMKQVADYWNEYLRQFNSAIKIASDSPVDALQIPDAIYNLQLMPMVDVLNKQVTSSLTQEDASTQTIRGVMSRILMVVLIPLIAGGLIVVLGQMLFARDLKRRVSRVQAVVAELEAGDLTKRLPEEGKDEIAEIAQAVNHFVSQAHDIMCQLRDSTDEVAAAATKLFSASEDIASSSMGQSEAASTVATTIEQMTVSVGQVADHAGDAHTISIESGQLLSQGIDVVSAASDEMNRISQSVSESSELIQDLEQRSADITTIINVIKDVAEQTNLLALNAAIEAARAGDLGRGFAVVADEVRNLAERTSNSTKEIANVIAQIQEATRLAATSMESGVQRVGKGVELVSQASETISKVRNGAERVVGEVDHISLALREQTTANEDIAQQVERIASISQENSSATQRTLDTARELEKLSHNLENAVKQFQL